MTFIEAYLIAENIFTVIFSKCIGRSLNQVMNEEYMPSRSAY